jgi:hypothetical protein
VIYLALALWFGICTGLIGRVRGSSFFIWFIIGAVVPVIGLVVALAYRSDRDELRRQCPNCGKVVKLHDAMCMRSAPINSQLPSLFWKELSSR